MIIKFLKTEEKQTKKILKSARKKKKKRQLINGGGRAQNNSNDSRFVIRNHSGQKEVEKYFQVVKEKKCQTRNVYPVKLSSKNQEEVKTFSVKRKLR